MYTNDCANPCIVFIRHSLDSCGFLKFLTEQCITIFTVRWILASTKQRLLDNCIQNVFLRKNNLETTIMKFRTSNHRSPIEIGSWNGIPVNDRIYTLCNTGKLSN